MNDEERLTTLQFFAPSFKQISFQLSQALNAQNETHYSLMYSVSLEKLPQVQKETISNTKKPAKRIRNRPKSSLNQRKANNSDLHHDKNCYRIMKKLKKTQLKLLSQISIKVEGSKSQAQKQQTFRRKYSKVSVTPKGQKTPIKDFENIISGEKVQIGEGLAGKNSRRCLKPLEMELNKFELTPKKKQIRVERRKNKIL